MVVLCLASLALAHEDREVFESKMICNTDGADPFTDTKGSVTIFDNGNLLINIPRLLPNKPYRVALGCAVGNKGPVFEDRSTNSRGRLLAFILGLGRSGPLATGCALPLVTVSAVDPPGGPEFCYAGYGQP